MYLWFMARNAEHFDPVVVLIEDDAPTITFEDWLASLGERERVDLGISAAELLAEARQAGEI